MPRLTTFLVLALIAGAGFGAEHKWNEKEVSFESVHPYPASSDDELEIREAGAAEIRLRFTRLEMEEGFDFLEIRDGSGQLIERYTGVHEKFWTPPIPGEVVKIRLITDDSVHRFGFAIDRISWRPPEEVVANVASIALELPKGPRIRAGKTAPLRLVARDPDGRPIDPVGHIFYFNIRGPIEVLAVDLPASYKIVTTPELLTETEAVVIAYSARSPTLRAETRIRVLPARPLDGLVLQAPATKVEAASEIPITVVGCPKGGKGGPQRLPPEDVVCTLTGPGTLVEARGPGARYVYRAPLIVRAPMEIVVGAYLKDEPEISGKLTLTLERRVFPRPKGVRAGKDLIRITGWWSRADSTEPWKKRKLPATGEVYRNKLQNHRLRFTVVASPAVQVEVDVVPRAKPQEKKTITVDEPGLVLTDHPDGTVTGEVRGQLRSGKGEYDVIFYVWTAPDRCATRTIRVIREKRD